MTKVALIQLNASDMPADNLPVTLAMVRRAAEQGAEFVLTPEVTNCVSLDRKHQARVLTKEESDPTLAALCDEAKKHAIWLLIGSLALLSDDEDGRFRNRSFLIGPNGKIKSRYDKIHMFDVQVTPEETFRESSAYRPGDQAVLCQTDFAAIGMSVCYDLRFPKLYRELAQAGAEILTIPSAFSPVTGAAHWEPLLRARAIENGCYVLAPAQTGFHQASHGKARRTYGHSMAIDPWGNVLCKGGSEADIFYAKFDSQNITSARGRVPSLSHDRPFSSPVLKELQHV